VDPAALYDTLAFVEGKSGRYEEAIAAAQFAVRQQPANIEFQITLVRSLLEGGRRDDATAAMKTLEQMQSKTQKLADSVLKDLDSLRQALATPARELSLTR